MFNVVFFIVVPLMVFGFFCFIAFHLGRDKHPKTLGGIMLVWVLTGGLIYAAAQSSEWWEGFFAALIWMYFAVPAGIGVLAGGLLGFLNAAFRSRA